MRSPPWRQPSIQGRARHSNGKRPQRHLTNFSDRPTSPLRRPLDSALATSNAARQSCCRETQSNARLSLAKAIGRLESGDVLVVTRLDRLARSTRDLLNVIDAVSKRGAGFRSLKDAWADTTSAHGRLM